MYAASAQIVHIKVHVCSDGIFCQLGVGYIYNLYENYCIQC